MQLYMLKLDAMKLTFVDNVDLKSIVEQFLNSKVRKCPVISYL